VQFLTEAKQKAAEFAEQNASTLLTAGGVIGTVATAVLAGRAGFKAGQIVLKKKGELYAEKYGELEAGDNPYLELENIETPKKDVALAVAIDVAFPIITGSATIAAIIMANRVSAQKAAALAAAYGLAERNFSEYREKMQEKLTGPKNAAIGEEVSQDRVNRAGEPTNIVVIEGKVLCFDEPTGRYFQSTMEEIKRAVNKINHEILNERGWVNATAFYHELDMPATSWTDDVGWNTDELLELKYDTVTSPDGRPCLSIDFNVLPKPDYVPKNY
jgi:hypothetical protein